MSFAEFMTEQIQAIEDSGLPPEEWIALNAEEFRATHPVESETN